MGPLLTGIKIRFGDKMQQPFLSFFPLGIDSAACTDDQRITDRDSQPLLKAVQYSSAVYYAVFNWNGSIRQNTFRGNSNRISRALWSLFDSSLCPVSYALVQLIPRVNSHSLSSLISTAELQRYWSQLDIPWRIRKWLAAWFLLRFWHIIFWWWKRRPHARMEVGIWKSTMGWRNFASPIAVVH